MSWEATAYVVETMRCPDGAEISASQKLLLLVLSNYHNAVDRIAWPGLPVLARKSHGSLSTVKRNLDYLEEHCVLERRERKKVGCHATNEYVFLEMDDPKRLTTKLKERVSGKRIAESSTQETVQNEPFCCPEENGSETGHKRSINGSETVQIEGRNGSETVQIGDAIRNDPYPTDPEPDPKPEQTLRSRKRDASQLEPIPADPRHKPVELAIKHWYCQAYSLEAGSCPWTAKTGALLKQLLAATPSHWMVAMLERCAMHWIYSWRPCGIPDRFIPRLLDRYEAPLDQYGGPDYQGKARCEGLLKRRQQESA
jgi:hypothetical protein